MTLIHLGCAMGAESLALHVPLQNMALIIAVCAMTEQKKE